MGLLQSIQAQRERTRKTFAEACVYAAQAVIALLIVLAVYRWLGEPGVMWAAVSAVLVLQPGFQRSLAASMIRVVANLLGVGIGTLVSWIVPDRVVAVCLSVVLIILACEVARLDAGVRSACASVLIVGLGTDPLLVRGVERAVAVGLGCGVALALQLATYPLLSRARSTLLGAGAVDEA